MVLNALSLFSSVGIAETYFERNGISVKVANELLPDRAKFYTYLYPNSQMICGDITNKDIFDKVLKSSIENNCNLVIATPPCQGMSSVGLKLREDPRNGMIIYAVEMIKHLNPDFAILENIPLQLKTKIYVDGKWILIPEYLRKELGETYVFNQKQLVNAMFYGVPQSRERCIFLLSKKGTGFVWEFPEPSQKIVKLREAIGDLPSLDPNVTDITEEMRHILFPDYERKALEGLTVSKWHYPPRHQIRHVEAMMHTPEGRSAWENEIYYPRLCDGRKSKGYTNTYTREWWDKPATTVTKYTSRLGGQKNGHPGRCLHDDGTEVGRIWSDPRVLSIYELIIVSSLPKNWDIPDWASSDLIRESIGEGVPPKLVEAAIIELVNWCKK